MRHIILHHHIFKNAGMTLDFSLKRQFGDAFANIHDDTSDGMVDEIMLFDYLDRHPDVKAVSSHHFHGQDYASSRRGRRYRFFDFAMVRRPLARFLSIYKFLRRSESADPLANLAKSLGPQ